MDVHPPHEPIHTWKDFFLHLLTITIGLFIALTLEAAVESMHHRHLVREARENLHHEIEANHQLYEEDMRMVEKNRERLAHDLDLLRTLRSGGKVENGSLNYGWGWDSFSEAAWKSARDGGAIAFMDMETDEGYSLVYGQQTYVNETGVAIMRDESKTDAPLVVAKDEAHLTPAEIETMLQGTAEIYQRLGALQSTMKNLDDFYTNALKTL